MISQLSVYIYTNQYQNEQLFQWTTLIYKDRLIKKMKRSEDGFGNFPNDVSEVYYIQTDYHKAFFVATAENMTKLFSHYIIQNLITEAISLLKNPSAPKTAYKESRLFHSLLGPKYRKYSKVSILRILVRENILTSDIPMLGALFSCTQNDL